MRVRNAVIHMVTPSQEKTGLGDPSVMPVVAFGP
jgi:hypothetical protein